ncbi:hypothetical protein OC846_000413 [Tilletia horrida]|uniref:C2H2-type domain-containing protein n=1 Tax=Tilletia horrida TaxID=155126 RepID=A0AAN6GUD2_9BASI|nr:hypothetical protein OC846_000413 [Tilletia horrida]
MSEKGPKKPSQDYVECRELFRQLIAEGLSVVRIIKDSGISIDLARRLAEDLGVPVTSKQAAANAEASASKAGAKTTNTVPKSSGLSSTLNTQQSLSKTPAQAASTSSTINVPKADLKAKPWRCPNWPRCDKHYQQKAGLDYHLQAGCKPKAEAADPSASPEPYSCPHGCGKTYISKGGLDYHLQGRCEALVAPQANNEQKLFICKVPGCTSRFSTLDGVTYHLMTSHGKLGQDLAQAMAS